MASPISGVASAAIDSAHGKVLATLAEMRDLAHAWVRYHLESSLQVQAAHFQHCGQFKNSKPEVGKASTSRADAYFCLPTHVPTGDNSYPVNLALDSHVPVWRTVFAEDAGCPANSVRLAGRLEGFRKLGSAFEKAEGLGCTRGT